MEVKQYVTKLARNHWRNQMTNFFKNLGKKWQEKHGDQKSMEAGKAVLRWKIIAIQSHLKKQGKFQISNLVLHLKQLEKEE